LTRRRLSTAQRRAFYAQACQGKDYPDCNICGRPVLPRDKWVDSHMPVPHALDGTETGVAHAKCNVEYWAKVEAPMLAKVKRIRDKHRGIHVSRHPMRRADDPRKRTVDGRVVNRETGEAWRR
jgi:hypothetical protein